jgi:hypothetical protein
MSRSSGGDSLVSPLPYIGQVTLMSHCCAWKTDSCQGRGRGRGTRAVAWQESAAARQSAAARLRPSPRRQQRLWGWMPVSGR